MKSIFENLKSGNFASIKNTISDALQGDSQQSPDNASSGVSNVSSGLSNMGGLSGLLGAGALGGLLGTLISGGSAQKVAKGALVMGGSAAVGALAWNFYKKWAQTPNQEQNTQSTPDAISQPAQASPEQSLAEQEQVPPVDDDTSMLLLEAMVFAARADGHIDEQEKQNISNVVIQMYPTQNVDQLIDSLINKPINPHSLAIRIKSPEEAFDVYRLSCMILKIDHFMERSYLDGLAEALSIPSVTKQKLELEVIEIKKQLAQS